MAALIIFHSMVFNDMMYLYYIFISTSGSN